MIAGVVRQASGIAAVRIHHIDFRVAIAIRQIYILSTELVKGLPSRQGSPFVYFVKLK